MTLLRRHPRDREIAALAIPALATLAIDPLVSIVDTAWVGRLGTDELAALAVASAVFAAAFSIFGFVHLTVTPLVAGEVGRGDLPRAGTVARGAFVISALIGVAVAAAAWFLADPVASVISSTGTVAVEAASYLRVRFLALPAMLVTMVGHGVYRGHSDTRTPLRVAIGLNIVNLVLDPVLIFGAGLGVTGAAWATVVAQGLAAVWFLWLVLVKDRRDLGTDEPYSGVGSLPIRSILSAGWPLMIRSAALLTSITATTLAAARIGTVEVAAHQIALQVWLFLSFVLDAYAVAAQPMVGTDLGAGKVDAARDVSKRLLFLGFVTGVTLSGLVAVSGLFVADVFSAADDVAGELARVYGFVVVLQPLTALVYVYDGIGIGASAFRFLAISMVVAAVATIATLWMVGDDLVGVWSAVTVLTVTRLLSFAVWNRIGPLADGRAPSPSSRAA